MFKRKKKEEQINEFSGIEVNPTDNHARAPRLGRAVLALPFILLFGYFALTQTGFLPGSDAAARARYSNRRDYRPKVAVVMTNQQTGQTIAQQITVRTSEQILGEYWTDCDVLDTAIVFGEPFVAFVVGEEVPPWGFGELCIDQLKSRPQNEAVPIICVTVNQIAKRTAFKEACDITITEVQMVTGKFSPGMFR